MKKIIMFALFLLAFGTIQAFAGFGPNFPREDENTPGYTNVTSSSTSGSALTRPVLLYGMSLSTNAANSSVEVFDVSTSTVNTSTELASAELADATQYDTKTVLFNPPIALNNGAYVNFTQGGGKVKLYYR